MLADTRNPVEGSMALAVVLAPVMKVMAPSCRADEPVGAAAGAKTALPDGEPASNKM